MSGERMPLSRWFESALVKRFGIRDRATGPKREHQNLRECCVFGRASLTSIPDPPGVNRAKSAPW